ncbi:MAG: tyrosine-type recombinase/integrase [Candidatus Eremiobacteraeota bacterium]|nr:tyrosine-type recombinase/integrase [Candidatus Eremiobacteraeota bacterium]
MKGHIRPARVADRNVFDVIIHLGRDENGKYRYTSKRVHGNKKAAQAECSRMLHELSTGAFVEPSKSTVAQFMTSWLEHAKTKVARRSYDRYEQIVRDHITQSLGHHALTSLRPLHVQSALSAWLQSGRVDGKGGLSSQTVRHHYAVLREALGCAVRWGILVRNVCDAVEPPKARDVEVVPPTAEAVATLLESVKGTRLEGPVWLAALTGLRRGEILGLAWSSVDLEAGVLTVRRTLQQSADGQLYFKEPKSASSRRRMELSPMSVDLLRRQKAAQNEDRLKLGPGYKGELVFAQADGSPWKPDNFSSAFPQFLERNGLPHIRFHDLRHSFATALARSGVHPRVAQQLLGHSDPRLTMKVYSHSAPDLERSAMTCVGDALQAALTKNARSQRS